MARATAPQGRVVTVSWVTTARLEHDPEKACRGLDPGWKPIFRNAHAHQKVDALIVQAEKIAL
jgi:hypothetical protein